MQKTERQEEVLKSLENVFKEQPTDNEHTPRRVRFPDVR